MRNVALASKRTRRSAVTTGVEVAICVDVWDINELSQFMAKGDLPVSAAGVISARVGAGLRHPLP